MTVKIVYRTQKQIEFLDKYIENGGNATKAWEDTHPDCNHRSAKQQGFKMMQKLDLSLTELFDRMGLTDGKLTERLKQGLDAMRLVSVSPIPKNQKNSPKDSPLDPNQPQLKVFDVPDMGVRVKYLDMAFKLKGKYASDRALDTIALSFASLMKAKGEQEKEAKQ